MTTKNDSITHSIPGVKNTLGVASGKGGVGKSTIALSLALGLQATGARVGILDADIYGPSLPTLLDTVLARPEMTADNRLIPVVKHGLQTMSIAYLLPTADAPIIWRGPMATRSLQQLLLQTAWDNLDYLVIDLPPGTGDIHLTLAQQIPVTGSVVVTTPDSLALADATKAINMFKAVKIPVLGIIENMSTHICSHCHAAEPLFDQGGGARLAAEHGLACMAEVPLALGLREALKQGRCDPLFDGIARQIIAELARLVASASRMPKIVVENL
jgi:ATP-binding protein involved in chromosome partitioning